MYAMEYLFENNYACVLFSFMMCLVFLLGPGCFETVSRYLNSSLRDLKDILTSKFLRSSLFTMEYQGQTYSKRSFSFFSCDRNCVPMGFSFTESSSKLRSHQVSRWTILRLSVSHSLRCLGLFLLWPPQASGNEGLRVGGGMGQGEASGFRGWRGPVALGCPEEVDERYVRLIICWALFFHWVHGVDSINDSLWW